MKRTLAVIGTLALIGAGSAGVAYADPDNTTAQSGTYLAVGDSLAAGYQPGLGDNKTGGYVGGVYASLKTKYHGLKLKNLACSGETSSSMIADSKCTYDDGGRSQLDAAVNAITAAKGKVRVITLNIGANDVQRCVDRAGSLDQACLQAGMGAVARNLPSIVTKLRQAAGANTQIVLLNYYNPFLAFWLAGNKPLAQLSTTLLGQLNASIAAGAAAGDAKVADIATAFRSSDWTVGSNGLPVNVATICGYTWVCTKSDIHANDAGYTLMSQTVTPQLHGPKGVALTSVG